MRKPWYNLFTNQTEFVAADGNATWTTYDAMGEPLQVVNPDLTTTTYSWGTNSSQNDDGLLTYEIDAYGQTESFQYDPTNGNLLQKTDYAGDVTYYQYVTSPIRGDSSLVTQIKTPSDDGNGATTTYNYDLPNGQTGNGDVMSVTDALGNTTSYSYGSTTSQNYLTDLPVSMTDPNGNTTTYTYDLFSPTELATDPADAYLDSGQVLSQTTTGTGLTAPVTVSSVYNGKGFLTSSTDGNDNTTSYTYDLLGHRVTETLPQGTTITYSYDADGDLLSTSQSPTVSGAPLVTRAIYDSMQRAIESVNADGTYTTDQYDANGNLVSQTDAMGRVTQYFYNSRNLAVETLQPDGGVIHDDYDGGGRLVSETDANGNTTQYRYDALGRETEVIEPAPGNGLPGAITTYSYDKQGNLSLVSYTYPGAPEEFPTLLRPGAPDPNWTTQYVYNKLNQKIAEIDAEVEINVNNADVPPTPPTQPLTLYGYDGDGNLVWELDPNAAYADGYSAASPTAWQNLTTPPSGATIFQYDALGRLVETIEPATPVTVVSQNGTSSSITASMVTIDGYDADGNITSVTNTSTVIQDGNFESIFEPATQSNYYTGPVSGSPWSFIAGAGIATNGSGWTNATPPTGSQFALIQSWGGVSQTVTLAPGSYTLSFMAAQRGGPYQPDYQVLEVLVDGNPVPNGNITPSGTQFAAYQVTFTITNSGSHTITIEGADPYGSGGDTAFIDQVLLQPTATPPITTTSIQNGSFETPVLAAETYEYYSPNSGTPNSGPLTGSEWTFSAYAGIATNGSSWTTTAAPDGNQFAFLQWGGSVSQIVTLNPGYYTLSFLAAQRPIDAPHYQVLEVLVDGNVGANITPTGTQFASYQVTFAISSTGSHTITIEGTDSQYGVTAFIDQVSLLPTATPLTTTYLYDSLGRKIAEVDPAPTPGAPQPITLYGYDANGNLAWTLDPNAAYVDGYQTLSDVQALYLSGWPTTPPNGATVYQYDLLGRQTSVTDPLGDTTTTVYDAVGNVLAVTNALGNTTRYQYDSMNRKIAEIDPAYVAANGSVVTPTTTYTYDDNGNLLSTTDADGNTTRYQYDALNRQVSVTDALGNVTTTAYDGFGNVASVTDPLGRTTMYLYDDLHRKIEEIDPDPATGVTSTSDSSCPTTLYGYDLNSNLTQVTDPDGNTTTYVYDALNRKIAESDDSLVNCFTFDDCQPGTTITSGTSLTDSFTQTTQQVQVTVTTGVASPSVVSSVKGNALDFTATTDNLGNVNGGSSITLSGLNADSSQGATNTVSFWMYVGYEWSPPVLTWGNYTLGNYWTHMDFTDSQGHGVATAPQVMVVYQYQWIQVTAVFYNSATQPKAQDWSNCELYIDGVQQVLTPINSTDNTPSAMLGVTSNLTIGPWFDGQIADLRIYNRKLSAEEVAGLYAAAISAPGFTTYQYDPYDNLASTTDAMGNTTLYVYDADGNKIEEIDPQTSVNVPGTETPTSLLPITYYGYDLNGNLEWTTDPRGDTAAEGTGAEDPSYTTWYFYDALNRQTCVVDALAGTTYSSDATPATQPANSTMTTYDAVGHVSSVTDPDGNKTIYLYDADGRKIEQIQPDPATGLTSTSDLNCPTTHDAYDAAGNLIQTTDPDGHEIQYAYDADNRQTTETWVGGNRTITTLYDADGEVYAVLDTSGASYYYEYDADGRLIRSRMVPVDLPQTATGWTWTYSGQSLPFQWQGTTYYAMSYTVMDTSEPSPQAADLDIGTTLTATLSNYTQGQYPLALFFESPSGEIFAVSYTGDTLQATLDEQGTWTVWVAISTAASPAVNYSISITVQPVVSLEDLDYTYDFDGNVKSVTDSSDVIANSAGTTTYTYDGLGDVTQITQQNASGGSGITSKDVEFTYNLDGTVATISRYNGLTNSAPLIATTSYQTTSGGSGYNADGEITAMQQTYGSTTLSYSWEYDAAGNIVKESSPDGGDNYTYDDTDQLTGASLTTESYSYDQNGNRVESTTTGSSTTVTCITGKDNELLYDGTYNYSYDADGNRTARWIAQNSSETAPGLNDTDITVYTWDYDNRLTSETNYLTFYDYQHNTADSVINYTYDYQGRLICQSENSGGATSYTYTVYDGQNAYLQVSDPYALAYGNSFGTVQVTQRYLYGQAVDQILATDNCNGATGVLWGLDDNQGTPCDVVNSAGTQHYSVQYTSFGLPTGVMAGFAFGLSGMRYNLTTHEYVTAYRTYDPATGQFLSPDPSGFGSGTTNLYVYCGNNPVVRNDPMGLCPGATGVVVTLGNNLPDSVFSVNFGSTNNSTQGSSGTPSILGNNTIQVDANGNPTLVSGSTGTSQTPSILNGTNTIQPGADGGLYMVNGSTGESTSLLSAGWNTISGMGFGGQGAIDLSYPSSTFPLNGLCVSPGSISVPADSWRGGLITLCNGNGSTGSIQSALYAPTGAQNPDQVLLNQYTSMMNVMINVGNRINSGTAEDWASLESDYPGITEAVNGGLGPTRVPASMGGVYSSPGPTAEDAYFPQNWPALCGALHYFVQNYSDINNLTVGPFNSDLVFHQISYESFRGVTGNGDVDYALPLLLHETQHDWSQCGWGHEWNGMYQIVPAPSTGFFSQGPNIPGPNIGGKDAYTAFYEFANSLFFPDGTNLWSKMKEKAGVPTKQD